MSDSPLQPRANENLAADELQFNTVEPAGSAAAPSQVQCVVCGQPIAATYYALGDQVLCAGCRGHITAPPGGSRIGRLIKASLLGLGAGLLGTLIWFAIRRMANLEIGIVAILVGAMVGKAVRTGSGDRGGRGYQLLAVAITYCCIAANYMPDIVEAVLQNAREREAAVAVKADQEGIVAGGAAEAPAADAPAGAPKVAAAGAEGEAPIGRGQALLALFVALVLIFALALAAPFLAGIDNFIGLLIIGFALWEAWKLNAWRQLPISGPYELGRRGD